VSNLGQSSILFEAYSCAEKNPFLMRCVLSGFLSTGNPVCIDDISYSWSLTPPKIPPLFFT